MIVEMIVDSDEKDCDYHQHLAPPNSHQVQTKNSWNISSFAVEPKAGWLFWGQTNSTDCVKPSSEIWRNDLNGGHLVNIATELGIVSGITIDHERFMLYRVDSFLQVIERARLDGSGREVFLRQQVQLPVTINVYRHSIYWLMGTSGVLQRCLLVGKGMCVPASMSNNYGYELFVISHGSRQPIGEMISTTSAGRLWRTLNDTTGSPTDGVINSDVHLTNPFNEKD